MKKNLSILIMMTLLAGGSFAQELKNIVLPAPVMTGGMPIMDALKVRQTGRVFSETPLSQQQLSNLLWAAFGINRVESGKRTAPSARNFQETTLYIALPEGIYQWDAKENILKPVVAGDHRAKMGKQPFVGTAPLVLVFVADYEKYGDMPVEKMEFYAGIDAGYISQNIYLYCASEKLSTVVLGSVDKEEVGKLLQLKGKLKVVVSQPVGFPGEE
jgi:SagB-type dehydrogenase family enzyme